MKNELHYLRHSLAQHRRFIEAGNGFVEPEMFRTRSVCAY